MAIRFMDPAAVDGVRDYVNNDPEFKLASKYVVADILLGAGDFKCIVKVREGAISEIFLNPTFMDAWGFYIKGSEDAWSKFLQPVPPPWHQGLFGAMIRQILEVGGNLEMAFSYFWAVTRMLDLFRQAQNR
ncbi:MAG: hypothetical protein ABSB94_18865 [Syntrophorhabdales bacterium]